MFSYSKSFNAYNDVLGLAGMELVSFTGVCAVLWSCDQSSVGHAPMFRLWLGGACTAARLPPFPALSHKKLGGDTADPAIYCSVMKTGGKEEKGEDVQSYGIDFPQFPLHTMKPCFPRSC